MSRFFITGDKHGSLELKKLSNHNWPMAKNLNHEDVICICGDAGFAWDNSNETEYWDDWTEKRPFTTIACFGNHENYDAIRALPIEIWNGARVRKVRPHIMYVENGEIFTFNHQTFFVMGGATSIDRVYRKEGKSWWASEIPSRKEMEYAADNLARYNMKVDHIITHTPPNFILDTFWYEHDPLTNFLENYVRQYVSFKHWWCGHLHIDRNFGDDYNYHVLYNDIEEIK